MNISKSFLILLIVTVFSSIFACETEDHKAELTVDDFRVFLKKDMTYEELVGMAGPPEKDLGSGIHIYEYPLNDNTRIWVGFTDKLVYAYHMDSDAKLIQEIVK